MASSGETVVPEQEIQEIGESHEHPQEITRADIVELYATLYGADATLAKKIIKCESGDRSEPLDTIEDYQLSIKNPNSTASGPFQFLNSTWVETMKRMGLPTDTPKDHPVISLQAGVWLLAKDGERHWLESKSCWYQYGV